MEKPFIYIASLRRTGSTVLSEALTLFPHSFIFREPGLSRRRFKVKPKDVDFFLAHGVKLKVRQEEIMKRGPREIAVTFKQTLLPELLNVVSQVGVKEIHHEHWEDLADAFPNMKVIVTGRDPRDIYISLSEKYTSRDRRINWKGPFTAQTVAESLDEDFERQRTIASALDCLKIRYEDFCTRHDIFEQIKAFVGSDIPGKGIIGGLAKTDYNTLIHGQEITDRRVYRWQFETDPKVLEQADEVFNLLEGYCEFWGYRKESTGSSATA